LNITINSDRNAIIIKYVKIISASKSTKTGHRLTATSPYTFLIEQILWKILTVMKAISRAVLTA